MACADEREVLHVLIVSIEIAIKYIAGKWGRVSLLWDLFKIEKDHE